MGGRWKEASTWERPRIGIRNPYRHRHSLPGSTLVRWNPFVPTPHFIRAFTRSACHAHASSRLPNGCDELAIEVPVAMCNSLHRAVANLPSAGCPHPHPELGVDRQLEEGLSGSRRDISQP